MAYDGILSKDMSSGMRELSGKINKRIKMLKNDPHNEQLKNELEIYKDIFQKLKEMHSINGVYVTGRYEHYKYPRKKKNKISDEEIEQALSNLPPKGTSHETK